METEIYNLKLCDYMLVSIFIFIIIFHNLIRKIYILNQKDNELINKIIKQCKQDKTDLEYKINLFDRNNKEQLIEIINNMRSFDNNNQEIYYKIKSLESSIKEINTKIYNLKATIPEFNTNLNEITFTFNQKIDDEQNSWSNTNTFKNLPNIQYIQAFDNINIITFNIMSEATYLEATNKSCGCSSKHIRMSNDQLHHIRPIKINPQNYIISESYKNNLDIIIKLINNNKKIKINIIEGDNKITFPYQWFNYLFNNININNIDIIYFPEYRKEYVNKYVLPNINNNLINNIYFIVKKN
jgi:hypothetical protein